MTDATSRHAITSAPGVDRPAAQPQRSRHSLGATAGNARREAALGNARALVHGVFAAVASELDVRVEIVTIWAIHPSLARLADARLVELVAMTRVRVRRIFLAIEREGFTPVLTSYDAKFSPLLERLERQLHERDLERQRSARSGSDPLDRYRSTDPGRLEMRS